MLEAFYTDVCGGRGAGRLATLARHLPVPKATIALADRLVARKPPAAVLKRTRTDDLATLRYEMAARHTLDSALRRHILIAHMEKRGRRLARWGLGDATHVFNVFGEGGQLIRLANERGLPVLADIIIALSTRGINLAEYDAYPDWGPPPSDPSYEEMKGFNPDRHLLETTDIFVCPSPFVADDLVLNWGVPREATRIIPYALSSDWFEIESRPKPGRVLFAGTADRRKGIHYLAKAALLLSGRVADFRVAGTVQAEVRNHPEAATLQFLGRVPRAQVRNEFASADIFVLPTLAEGSATVVYEAMAMGLPVITTRAAGSVIRNGVDGVIVPERDPEALAAAIERLVADRALRDAIGEAARESARQWTWETYTSSLVSAVLDAPSFSPRMPTRKCYRG